MTTNQLKEIIKKVEGMKHTKQDYKDAISYDISPISPLYEMYLQYEDFLLDKVITLLKQYEHR